jgi:GNAT superfamily N-acetyltransferase
VTIEPFRHQHAAAFDSLNRAWLSGLGILEAADEPHLRDPHGSIVDQGGQIFVAVERDTVIGTCAITPHGHDEFELLKLTVAPVAQGRGIGRQLVQACVQWASTRGARRVTLLSASLLKPALRIYEQAGFRYEPVPPSNPYVTADVYMVLDL